MSAYQPKPFSDPFAKSGWWVLLEHATVDRILTQSRRRPPICWPAPIICLIHTRPLSAQQLAQAAYPLPPGLAEAATSCRSITGSHHLLAAAIVLWINGSGPGAAFWHAHLASIRVLVRCILPVSAEIQDVQRRDRSSGTPAHPSSGSGRLAKFAACAAAPRIQ
jgi:hypothetical protein